MVFESRHLFRAICLMWSLYLIVVECGVDLSKFWNRTFITDYYFLCLANRCEYSTLANTRQFVHTTFKDRVSKFLRARKKLLNTIL